MKRALMVLILSPFVVGANAQNVLTGKVIYRANCPAIVQIRTNDTFGVGFITSSNGIVVTANHVVTTPSSHFRQYASDIKVFVAGKTQPYQATPIPEQVSDEQVNYDSAILKIAATNLPVVKFGDWADVDIGDSVTVIPSFPGIGCLLLEGTIAAKGPAQTDFGPKPVNTILFQSPIRNGFSGAPIFNSKGRVIGIEDTKVFGISPALAELRTKWASNGNADISINGAAVGGSVMELINNLDQNLISGLGSGVDVRYAKQEQGGNKSQQQR